MDTCLALRAHVLQMNTFIFVYLFAFMLFYYTWVLSDAKLTPLHILCRQNQNSVLLCSSFSAQEAENVSGKFLDLNDTLH